MVLARAAVRCCEGNARQPDRAIFPHARPSPTKADCAFAPQDECHPWATAPRRLKKTAGQTDGRSNSSSRPVATDPKSPPVAVLNSRSDADTSSQTLHLRKRLECCDHPLRPPHRADVRSPCSKPVESRVRVRAAIISPLQRFRDNRVGRCKPASGEYVRKCNMAREKVAGRFCRNRLMAAGRSPDCRKCFLCAFDLRRPFVGSNNRHSLGAQIRIARVRRFPTILSH